jgi:hypothetical protein
VAAESILKGWAYKLFLRMASVQRQRPESLPLRESRKGDLRGTLPGAMCPSRVSCRGQMGGVETLARGHTGCGQAVVSAEPGKWPGHNTRQAAVGVVVAQGKQA